jgi:hypothetical protein
MLSTPELSINLPPKVLNVVKQVIPDLHLTSLGTYVENDWTEFMDREVLHQPYIRKGFSLFTYPWWLDWQYQYYFSGLPAQGIEADKGSFQERYIDNPIKRGLIYLLLNFDIVPFWSISFQDKNFSPEPVKYGEEIISPPHPVTLSIYPLEEFERTEHFFNIKYDSPDPRIERELIQDPIGRRVMVERIYTDYLAGLTYVMLSPDNDEQDAFIWTDDIRTYNPTQGVGGRGVYKITGLKDIEALHDTKLPLYLAITDNSKYQVFL